MNEKHQEFPDRIGFRSGPRGTHSSRTIMLAGWLLHDFSDAFAHWLAGRKYRDSCFDHPEHLDPALVNFRDTVVHHLKDALTRAAVDQNTVVAVQGIACLFGFIRVSDVVNAVEGSIRGRLLVFFPGEYAGAAGNLTGKQLLPQSESPPHTSRSIRRSVASICP